MDGVKVTGSVTTNVDVAVHVADGVSRRMIDMVLVSVDCSEMDGTVAVITWDMVP